MEKGLTAKDKITTTFGIIYSACVLVIWIILLLPYSPCYPCPNITYIGSPGGTISLIGALILIPSNILYIIFFAAKEADFAIGGYGFCILGYILGITGQIYHLIWYPFPLYPNFIPIFLLIVFTFLVIFGTLIYVRRQKGEELPISNEENWEEE